MIDAFSFRDNFRMPSVWDAFGYALGIHGILFIWNPTLLSGGHAHQAPILMQVEFREKLPTRPKPPQVVKKVEPKAHKAGISLAHQVHSAAIHPVKHPPKLVARPAPRSRPAPVKMPKFIPHASDDDALAAINHPTKLATTTALRPPSSPFTPIPKLRGKTSAYLGNSLSSAHGRRGRRIGG